MRSLLVGGAVCLLVAGCVKRVVGPTEALDEAVADVADGSASARAFALAGAVALFGASDFEQARSHFDAALAKNAAEPWALWGQLTLAQRQGQVDRALTVALDVIERAPRHPLSAVAARFVLDHSTEGISTDDLILSRVDALLEKRPAADAAYLLRAAVSSIAEARGDTARVAAVLADLGVPTVMAVIGPVSPFHVLSLTEPSTVEKTGSLADLGAGPFGPLVARAFSVADGRVSLGGEPQTGDGYLFVVDVEVKRSGRFVLRTVTSMDHVARLDGTVVLERQTWQRPASTSTARALELDSGLHRLVVRAHKGAEAGHMQFALQRLDGAPADLVFRLPAGAAPSWSGDVSLLDDVEGVMPTAASVHRALADEGSDALARLVAARDGLGRDVDGARRQLAGVPASLSGAAVQLLRAHVDLADQTVAPKVAHGRATRELEAALTKDPGLVPARLTLAQLVLDDGRSVDALAQVKLARTSAQGLLLQARIELALGLEAQAVITAKEAVVAWPGQCEALLLQSDVARRRDAVADAEALLAALARCPNAGWRVAEHERARGNIEAVVTAWTTQLARDESQLSVVSSLASALVALGRLDEALTTLARGAALWPRNAAVVKQAADVLELAGKQKEALAQRERALELDPADLALRRTVERLKTGRELLDAHAISTAAALKAYEAAPGAEDANAAFLLDAAAIEAFPDGTQVDRVHIIQKALDQAGVQEVAEVQVPAGAVVLSLRTLKADGRTLEPEAFEGKDTVSLPGVEVGDLVEYEYLVAHPSRGPAQPGFTASSFYFQVARQPNNWSTYTVIAPKGSGLTVDAHNLPNVSAVKVEGDKEVFFHEEKRVAPYIPEPVGPPSPNEWLPFVNVGAGDKGVDGLLRASGDAVVERGLITHEVEAFAMAAAGPLVGREAVRAVYRAVMKKLSGRDAGLAMSAAATVGQDRGSRTWLLHAALTALGFDARLAVVRGFNSDPAPYVFPNEALLPYLCVRVMLPEGALWLDPMVRFAPFAELPEFALGGRDAWLLPAPGRPLEKVQTPAVTARPSKVVALEVSLDAQGVLRGHGEETYQGFEAAQLAEALEQLTPDQRKQAIEQALSRMFGGADLESVEVAMQREDDNAPVKVSYAFTASRFARPEGDALVLGSLTFPWNLGRRYLTVGQRLTPLFIESSESTRSVVHLTVPEGFHLKDPVTEVKTECPWGRFVRKESQRGAIITIEEEARLSQTRVPVEGYERFGQFAGEADLLQGRDLLLVR